MGKRRETPKLKRKPAFRKPNREAEERLRALLKEWDDSGKVKTSAYYRLQAQLAESDE